ncbi:MAG: cyclic nucleotide-binding domain-containing protein [Candidatus Kerfeldbacteria bacterium]|nr:cyclic nucleotide-binding domain-containing protein [Candidatus Kerfeldbacteria bacterium]
MDLSTSAGRLAFLKTHPYLRGMPEPIMESLLREGTVVTFKRGDTLVRQGEVADVAYLIASGTAMGATLPGSRQLTMHHWVGELGALLDDPVKRVTTITVTSEELVALCFSFEALRAHSSYLLRYFYALAVAYVQADAEAAQVMSPHHLDRPDE